MEGSDQVEGFEKWFCVDSRNKEMHSTHLRNSMNCIHAAETRTLTPYL